MQKVCDSTTPPDTRPEFLRFYRRLLWVWWWVVSGDMHVTRGQGGAAPLKFGRSPKWLGAVMHGAGAKKRKAKQEGTLT